MRTIGMLLGIPEAGPGGASATAIDEGLRLDEGAMPDSKRSFAADETRRRFEDVHRLARRASLRRPDDRAAPGRVRGRRPAPPPAHPRGGARLRQPARRRRQRDDDAADRLDGQGARRSPRSAHASSSTTAASCPTRSRRCCASSHRRPCRRDTSRATSSTTASVVPDGQRDAAADRVGQPRRAQVPGRRPLRHPPQDRSPPRVRVRHPLLPRRRARAAGRPGGARRGAAAVPVWEVDWDNAVQARTSTVRGWERLPVTTPSG